MFYILLCYVYRLDRQQLENKEVETRVENLSRTVSRKREEMITGEFRTWMSFFYSITFQNKSLHLNSFLIFVILQLLIFFTNDTTRLQFNFSILLFFVYVIFTVFLSYGFQDLLSCRCFEMNLSRIKMNWPLLRTALSLEGRCWDWHLIPFSLWSISLSIYWLVLFT